MLSSFDFSGGRLSELGFSVEADAEILLEISHYFGASLGDAKASNHVEVSCDERRLAGICAAPGEVVRTYQYKPDLVYTEQPGTGGIVRTIRPQAPSPQTHAFLEVTEGEWHIVLGSVLYCREVVRFLRTWMRALLARRGFGCLHAAIFDCPAMGGAVVIGDSGRGKSTIAWSAAQLGYGYVANDRGFIGRDDRNKRPLVGIGCPTAMRIGRGLAAAHRETLFTALPRRQRGALHWFGSTDWAIGAPVGDWGSKDKLELTPLEVEQLTGAPYSLSCEISTVVVTRLSRTGGPTRIRQAESGEVRDVVCRNILEPLDSSYPEHYFVPSARIESSAVWSMLVRGAQFWMLEGGPCDVEPVLSTWGGCL